jgi:hypothetical protein
MRRPVYLRGRVLLCGRRHHGGTPPSPTYGGDHQRANERNNHHMGGQSRRNRVLSNALASEKTKHIGMKWHFLNDHVELGTIRLMYLPTDQMVAEMFTKPLLGPTLTRHRRAIMGGADPMQRLICSYIHGGVVSNIYYLLVTYS